MQASKPLLIDAHVHLLEEVFLPQFHDVLAEAKRAGVVRFARTELLLGERFPEGDATP